MTKKKTKNSELLLFYNFDILYLYFTQDDRYNTRPTMRRMAIKRFWKLDRPCIYIYTDVYGIIIIRICYGNV